MMFQKALQKKRNGEGGFTLIELLVVMIIIGILAAIAIPLFLNQKEKARETALKNDLRNLATYAESYAVDHNGQYTSTTAPVAFSLATATADGFVPSTSYTLTPDGIVVNAAANDFCVQGTIAGTGGAVWSYDSNRAAGTPQLNNTGC